MKNVHFLFLFAILFGLGANGEEKASECQAEWTKWENAYGGRTPFAASNKTSDWPFKASDVEKILSGEKGEIRLHPKLALPLPMPAGLAKEIEHRVQEAIIRPAHQAIQENQPSYNIKLEGRNEGFLGRIHRTMKQQSDDELLIVMVGAFHIFQFYAHYPQSQGLFVSLPFRSSSQFGSHELRELHRLLGPVTDTPTHLTPSDLKRIAEFTQALAYLQLMQSMYRGSSFEAAALLSPLTKPSRAILISDTHHIEDSRVIQELPSAKCLRERGFKRVTFLTEGLIEGERRPTTSEFVLASDYVEVMKATSPAVLDEIKKKRPDVYALLISGKVIEKPNQLWLARRLRKYELDGLDVRIHGLDTRGNDREFDLEWHSAHQDLITLQNAMRKGAPASKAYEVTPAWERVRKLGG